MKHAATRKLYAHWDRLRAGRPAPGRDEVDPAAIRDVLASVFVIDVANPALPRPADAIFRLSGTRLDALFDRALRGSAFDRIWSDDGIPRVSSALATVLDERVPVLATAAGAPPGRDPIEFELLLLPLEARAGLGTPILGSLVAACTPGWMGLSASMPLVLRSFGPARGDERIRTFGRRGPWSLTVHPGGRGGVPPIAARI